jgi:hypothetical protein
MSELSYTLTFDKLMQSPQPKEFHGLLTTSKQLLDTAHHEDKLPKISKNPHVRPFIDTPNHVQALWEMEKNDVTYPRDRLAVNMAQGALWISMSYNDLQPDRSLTIGNFYANVSEQNPLRAQYHNRELRNDRDPNYLYNPEYVAEYLAKFAMHLDNSIELLGLSYAVSEGLAEEAIKQAA